MKLRSLHLTNYCNHRDCQITFSPYLTAILGRNGSGKSNILAGIRWALTGEDQNTGRKDENISWDCPDGEPVRVSLDFEHLGTSYEAVRQLKPKQPAMLYITRPDGSTDSVRGEKQATQAILDALNVNISTLSDYVLVAQGEMFSFLAKQPATRAAEFQRLFHLDALAECHQFLDKYLRNLSIPQTGIDRDQLRAEIQELEHQLEVARQRQQQYAIEGDFNALQAADDQIVAAWTRTEQLLSTRAARSQQIADIEDQLHPLNLSITKGEEDLQVVREAMTEHEPMAEQARQILSMWDQYQRQSQAREEVAQRLRAIEREIQSLQAPAAPEELISEHDLQATEQQLADLQAVVASLHKFVSEFDPETGVSACPECGTPTTHLAPRVEDERKRLQQLRAQVQQLEQTIRVSREYYHSWYRYSQQLEGRQQLRASLEQQLQSLQDISPPDTPRDQLESQITTYRQHRQAVADFEPQLQALRERRAALTGELDSLRQQVAQCDQQLEASNVTEAEAARARDRRHLRQKAYENWHTCANEVAGITARLEERQHQQDRLLEIEAQAAHQRQWAEFIAEMRDLVHRDALPKFLAYARLTRLQQRVNELLGLFGADFRVSADEELSFTATFLDGKVQPAERLSGGQQVVLAVSFRGAVNSMFAGDVGLLSLDEPTVYLDDDYIERFQVVLGTLREVSASTGLQVLITTHEARLAPLFDQVIELSPYSSDFAAEPADQAVG